MKKSFPILLLLLFCAAQSFGIVKYDEGRIMIDGIQLLQDREKPNDYYYLPQYPRLAQREDGSFEIICIKYVGSGGPETNGGLFHALVEFTLPPDVVDALSSKLKQIVPAGKIVGPVPMQENMKDGESGLASFEVISSILGNTSGENAFTLKTIHSGHAPLLPGSRAAIAARLSQEGATLLWSSFQGGTSDVSISINGYYEAAVRGYNAVIEAEVSTVYTHFSQILNEQSGATKDQLRDITDKLIQQQMIKIDVMDRSAGLGIKTDDMQAIVDLVTNKLIELMFDAKTGWAQVPKTEAAVEQGQLPGRQERGAFMQFFAGTGDQEYVTDHQFVLKQRKDVRVNKFYLNLSKSTTIKVPFFSTGNIRGFYNFHGDNEAYFRVVNLDDPDFKKRDIMFQIDGEFAQAFREILNFVTVSFKKTYSNGQADVTKEIVIKGDDLEKGIDLQSVSYPGLGLTGDQLIDYQYRISWSFKGDSKTINLPQDPTGWLTGREAAVSLKPPFEKRMIEIDADREMFKEAGMKSATIRFFSVLNGKAQVQRTVVLRQSDAISSQKVALYCDPKQLTAYQINWYPAKSSQPIEGEVIEITDNFLYLVPPEK
ncbi:MAG: hypothetical protein IPL65_10995 [Lewinellaceae bacterium]|nr:hypothetical protein [Lewinellaceae bacterium]